MVSYKFLNKKNRFLTKKYYVAPFVNFSLILKEFLYLYYFLFEISEHGTYNFNHYNRLLLGIVGIKTISNNLFLNEEILLKSETVEESVILEKKSVCLL